uniref:Ig-like domain-containing protein n=1 Tax=Astyanax mexicanus TaxID=7994 RepID=A0A8B9GS38_ASTMX
LSDVAADGIQPFFSEKRVLEGADVTLSCNYTASYINGLQWYRQYPESEPEFLISLTETEGASNSTLRLTAKADKQQKQVDLNISRTAVSDSALYYCALVPTVTENHKTLTYISGGGAVSLLLIYLHYHVVAYSKLEHTYYKYNHVLFSDANMYSEYGCLKETGATTSMPLSGPYCTPFMWETMCGMPTMVPLLAVMMMCLLDAQ